MAWGIILGIVIVGFVGLLSQVSNFSMCNIWISVLVGGVGGGVIGWIFEVIKSSGEKKKASAS